MCFYAKGDFLAPKPDVEDVFSIKTVPLSDEYNDVLLYVINRYFTERKVSLMAEI